MVGRIHSYTQAGTQNTWWTLERDEQDEGGEVESKVFMKLMSACDCEKCCSIEMITLQELNCKQILAIGTLSLLERGEIYGDINKNLDWVMDILNTLSSRVLIIYFGLGSGDGKTIFILGCS